MRIALVGSSQFAIHLIDYFQSSCQMSLIYPHDAIEAPFIGTLINFCDFGDHIKVRTLKESQTTNRQFDLLIGTEKNECPVRASLQFTGKNQQNTVFQTRQRQVYQRAFIQSFGRTIVFCDKPSSETTQLTGVLDQDLCSLIRLIEEKLRWTREQLFNPEALPTRSHGPSPITSSGLFLG